jgi:hypothetical protein
MAARRTYPRARLTKCLMFAVSLINVVSPSKHAICAVAATSHSRCVHSFGTPLAKVFLSANSHPRLATNPFLSATRRQAQNKHALAHAQRDTHTPNAAHNA